jgi:hypothetical protein
MKIRLLLLVVFLTSVFSAGCVPKQSYYFGNYSQTLYAAEKYQNEDAYLKHKQELEKVISESEVRNLPVPPGIYAELGYINLKENNPKEAIRLFQVEAQLYPESKHLMDRLIQSANAKEITSSSRDNLSTSNDSVSK